VTFLNNYSLLLQFNTSEGVVVEAPFDPY